MAFPTTHLEFSTAAPLSTSPAWVDLSTRLISGEYKYGRQFELDTTEVGMMKVTCRNNDLNLDPDYPSGTWYGTLDLGRRIRLWVVANSTTYYLFDGHITDFNMIQAGYNEVWAEITAECALGLLSKRALVSGAPFVTTNKGLNKDITLTARGVGFGWMAGKYQSSYSPLPSSDLNFKTNGRTGLAANLPLVVALDQPTNTIFVKQSTDANKNNTATAADIVDAINSHAVIAPLVKATIATGQNGSGILADFGPAPLAGGYPSERSDLRFTRALDSISWPSSFRNIVHTGVVTVQGITFSIRDNMKAQQHLQDVAKAERGIIFADGEHKIVFQDRDNRTRSPYSVSAATFSDAPTGSEFGYIAIKHTRDDTHLLNYVSISRQGGNDMLAQDATSISKYSQRDYSDSLMVNTDAQALTAAQYIRDKYKTPKVRFDSITIQVTPSDTTLWSHVLGLSISRKITVKRHPEHPAAIAGYTLSMACFIEAVSCKFEPNTKWQTTWELSPA